MVFIKVKVSQDDEFIYETKTENSNDGVIREVSQIHNLRIRLRCMATEMEEFKKYGPSRPPEKIGLETDDEDNQATNSDSNKKDPSGRRVGEPVPETSVQNFNSAIEKAKKCLSKERTKMKDCITMKEIESIIEEFRGTLMIAYPQGLPDHDPLFLLLKDDYTEKDFHDPESATMWFAGKELRREKKLSETPSIGRNEKTTIVVKLQKKGYGAPSREPSITAEEQKKLMSYWYKKQEEQKKLDDDDDDSYLNSVWANPKGLKTHFHGISSVSFPKK